MIEQKRTVDNPGLLHRTGRRSESLHLRPGSPNFLVAIQSPETVHLHGHMGRVTGQPPKRAKLAKSLFPQVASVGGETEQLADGGRSRRQLLGLQQHLPGEAVAAFGEGTGAAAQQVESRRQPVLASDAGDLLAQPFGKVVGATLDVERAPSLRRSLSLPPWALLTGSALAGRLARAPLPAGRRLPPLIALVTVPMVWHAATPVPRILVEGRRSRAHGD